MPWACMFCEHQYPSKHKMENWLLLLTSQPIYADLKKIDNGKNLAIFSLLLIPTSIGEVIHV